MSDKQDIDVPAGTAFRDVGPDDPRLDTGDNYLPVTLQTTKEVDLKRGQRCATVSAVAQIGGSGLVVAPGNHRAYRFSGVIHAGGPFGIADLIALPASAFR